MRITSKGQVTIPAAIRERAGLLPHMEVEFDYDGKAVRIFRARGKRRSSRGKWIAEHLKKHRGGIKMTTDEIMALTRGE